MGKAIGIDLGTTNTAVAVLVDGRPRVLEDEKGYKVLPSCVAFKGDGSQVVGQAARNLIITQPENTAYAIKRLMGRRFDSPEVAEVQKLVSYRIQASDDGLCKVHVGEQWLTPVQISAVILRVAKEMAERALGEEVDEAVITVPAYFNHAQRSATFDAARLAGLRCERLLNEPTAAALAYGYRKDVERRIVVYDLGGGTFDVSVLQLARGIYEVLATSGETHLGGEDFDQRIVDQLSEDFQSKTGVDPRTDSTALQRLKDAAERAKCELSFTDRTSILIPMITMVDSLETSLTRLAVEGLVEDLIDRTLEITRDAIKSAGLRLSDIDDVILVGGQTRMPRVREAIRSLFQKEPSRSVHPEEVVAVGAAVHATSLTSLDATKPLLLDVTPFDLGIDVAGGLFKRIIQANSQVPASFTETFATVKDNQRHVRVTVRQGSDPVAVENEFLGEFVMGGLSPAPRMETKVEVTFKIDTNGMLHVAATEQGTEERKRITIRNYAEFVKGEGIAPDLEGDLGGPEPDPDPSDADAGGHGAAGKAAQSGFLSRIFGRRSDPPAVSAGTERTPVEGGAAGASSDPAEVADTIPAMPSFLEELGDGDLAMLEPIEDFGVPESLDMVGSGLDALGMDDLAPLSAADLAPIPAAVSSGADPSTAGAEGSHGEASPDEQELFALPDDDEYYADEDEALYDEDDGMFAYGDGGFDDDDPEPDTPTGASPEPEPETSVSETIAGFDMSSDDDLLASEDFEVDDSARLLVQEAVSSSAIPLPTPEVEDEDLWGEEDLPDDGTVEYTRDGAVSTPRVWTIDDEPEDLEDLLTMLEGSPTLTGAPDPSPEPANSELEIGGTDPETESESAVSEPLEDVVVAEDGSQDPSGTELPHADIAPSDEPLLFEEEDFLLEEEPTLTGHEPSIEQPISAATHEEGSAPAPLPAHATLVDAHPVDFDDAPTDPPMEVDHRHRMRFDFSTPQRLAEELVTALRRGGCFVSTDAPHPQGTKCTIEYNCAELPEPVAVDAVVTWSTADLDGAHDRHTPGMDVDFQAPLRERKRLIAAIEALI